MAFDGTHGLRQNAVDGSLHIEQFLHEEFGPWSLTRLQRLHEHLHIVISEFRLIIQTPSTVRWRTDWQGTEQFRGWCLVMSVFSHPVQHPRVDVSDEDMTTLDMTKNIAYMHICQVISSANYSIIYLCYPEQKYFTHFCVLSNCRCMGHLYNPHMKIRKKDMFICCPKSSLTSLLAQEKIESKSLTFWIQIRTAQTYLTQNAHKFFIRTPNWVILFLLQTRFRALSNPIGITLKFVRSVELWTKQSDAAAESESNYKSKGVTSPPLGPIGLVRPRFSFRLPWDVLPPPWPPPLAPI